ncbi:hypothetical protein K8369_29715 [Streptomyces sp. PSKA30]|nr:hypothetical protein [Streptomyces sp. PSKA30]MBZ9643475.1 hypothetical protein [Streptomyces sp. PSKA30]
MPAHRAVGRRNDKNLVRALLWINQAVPLPADGSPEGPKTDAASRPRSVIAGAALLGAVGALIAIPAVATLQAFLGA